MVYCTINTFILKHGFGGNFFTNYEKKHFYFESGLFYGRIEMKVGMFYDKSLYCQLW